MKVINIFDSLPHNLNKEVFEDLVSSSVVRIERIVSKGQSSPDEGWYDQEEMSGLWLLREMPVWNLRMALKEIYPLAITLTFQRISNIGYFGQILNGLQSGLQSFILPNSSVLAQTRSDSYPFFSVPVRLNLS